MFVLRDFCHRLPFLLKEFVLAFDTSAVSTILVSAGLYSLLLHSHSL